MSIPLSRLTYMDLIRGFVAVGRKMSITLAAEDLYLSQSAVSRQVRTLEQILGIKLFVRKHRSLSFTVEGECLYHSANQAVQQLQDILGNLTVSDNSHSLSITASIGVSGLWLLPQLSEFRRQHPGINVRVSASNHQVDLHAENIDLAIRYCPQTSVPKEAVRLFGETIAAVAHPSLAIKSIDNASELAKHCLLEFDDSKRPWLQWNHWLKPVGWESIKPKGMLYFNQYDQMIQAAIEGQGIALGRLEILNPMLTDGRLKVISRSINNPASDYAYWLILAEKTPRADVMKFVDWLSKMS